MSTMFYIAAICGIVYMYTAYASRSSCYLNIFFITWTAILLAVMMVISLNSKVYCVFLITELQLVVFLMVYNFSLYQDIYHRVILIFLIYVIIAIEIYAIPF